MFCYKARKLISLEMDDLLPANDTPSLEKHLAECGDCRAYREDLSLGSRLLRATADEPSESFEWNFQLKLNRALQAAAAERTVPWEEAPSSGTGWWRSFAVSSFAGVAAAALVAVLIWPSGDRLTLPEASQATAPSTRLAAIPDATDRLPITTEGSRYVGTGAGLFGHQVNQSLLSDPARLVSSRLSSMNWSGQDMQGLGSLAAIREQNLRLRSALQRSEQENAALKSLLGRHGIEYLDEGAAASR